MRLLRLRSKAEAEIAETLDWYHDRSPAAAAGFLAALDQTLTRIRENPTGFPQVSSTLRRALVPHYPYGIYFRVFHDVISVVGIVHGRRHPRRWRRRG